MPRNEAIDAKKLIKMVKDGTPRPEIMKAFGFKTSAQLNTAYMNAAMDEGMVPEIKGGKRGAVQTTVSKEVPVGMTGRSCSS